MKQLILILVLTLSAQVSLFSQTKKTDSLRNLIYHSSSTSSRLASVLSLCEEYQSLNRDTLDKYALLADRLSLATGNKRDRALARFAMGNSYMRWGWTDSALAVIDPELNKFPSSNSDYRDIHFRFARQKAMCYAMKSSFKEALAILYGIISDAEKYHDTVALAANMNTIGSVALARGETAESINWFKRALAVCRSDNRFLPSLAAININLGNAYHAVQNDDSALVFMNKGLSISRQIDNLFMQATALRGQSNIFLSRRMVKRAEEALQEMIRVREKTNDGSNQFDDVLQLVEFYTKTEQFEKAIDLCSKNLKTGNLYDTTQDGQAFVNTIELRIPLYEALARVYRAMGNNTLYQQTLERIIAAKDSAYDEGAAKAIAEIQTRYEVQKKENTIIQQKLDITRKNDILYGSIILSACLVVIALLMFRNYSRRQRLKLTLMQIEEKRLAALAVKNAEEKERVRIAADLHDNLGAYAASISSNLDYIRVEETDSMNKNALQELRTNATSIVSQLSDTIWALNKESLSLTAISDRIKLLFQRMNRSYPLVSMEVREKIDIDHALPPSQAFHLFRIVQEAVTNALKHASARHIRVLVEGNESWRIEIADDGSGMKLANPKKMGGNGLLNMNKRAAESGWQISWTSKMPSGTAVLIEPTTN